MSSRPASDLQLFQDASLDKNILAKLPKDTQILTTTPYSYSDWSRPLKIVVELPGGAQQAYFLKITSGDNGRDMVLGEFESMTMFYTILPTHVIAPVAYGACASSPDIYFFMSDFHHLDEESRCDYKTFCAMAVELHRRSVEMRRNGLLKPAPEGKYGFHVTTHLGMIPKDNRWCDTWESFFDQAIRRVLAFEERTHGPSDELDQLVRQLLNRVIPRLLRPLESEGRTIEPVLAHGDLQLRNARLSLDTKQLVIFDAGAFWAHNEYDVAKWVLPRFKMGPQFVEEYHTHMPKSEPVEDWDDRIKLYTIHYNLMSSAHYGDRESLRDLALQEMRDLVEKYSD